MTDFSSLMAPGRIGGLQLRNRILMAPMGDSLANDDGSISDNQAAYFEARARGGAALLLVGSVAIAYPRACTDAHQVAASDDKYLPGLMDLTARVHRHGGSIAAQIVHNGQIAIYDIENGVPMLVPSVPKPAKPDRHSMMVTAAEGAAMMAPFVKPGAKVEYQVMTEADIAETVAQYVDCAERCVRAGFDAIELHAGHGYLIDEFLTPSLNVRTDGWGGSVPNRARFLLEIIRAIRGRMGRELPLWIRINAVEHHKSNGEVFTDQLEVIKLAVAEGIDAVHVTAYGSTDVATMPTDGYAPHTYTKGKPGSLTEYARVVRATVDVPVITMGRMEPDEADEAIADGATDFVAMGRKLVADPDLPNKVRDGRLDDIRPCIYQYRCIGNIYIKDSLHCVGNAAAGREHDLEMGPSANPRHVLVVGGGPAGLESARLLASRGHRVTLWESATELGGMLRYAGKADRLLELYRGWLIRQVDRAGVDIALGRAADVAAIDALRPDEVVVASGASWGRSEVRGADRPHVFSVPALGGWLADGDASSVPVGQRVVLIGGGKPSMSIGTTCLERGRSVTVIEATNVFCPELGLPGRWRLVADIEAAGARLVDLATVAEITADGVRIERNGASELIAADTVVVTNAASPMTALIDELRAAGRVVHTVGDCAGVRRIEGANLDAAAVALALG